MSIKKLNSCYNCPNSILNRSKLLPFSEFYSLFYIWTGSEFDIWKYNDFSAFHDFESLWIGTWHLAQNHSKLTYIKRKRKMPSIDILDSNSNVTNLIWFDLVPWSVTMTLSVFSPFPSVSLLTISIRLMNKAKKRKIISLPFFSFLFQSAHGQNLN